jgi:hypothetical protein
LISTAYRKTLFFHQSPASLHGDIPILTNVVNGATHAGATALLCINKNQF